MVMILGPECTLQDASVQATIADSLRRHADSHPLPCDVRPADLETAGGVAPITLGWHWQHRRDALQAACARRGIRIDRLRSVGGGKMLTLTAMPAMVAA